ncbi:hypothetical protein B0H21DRAFT_778771 [Amylocystis lapponica]|nr:hypothetical protein B0H21DRAFT_778771 [Amylocystis lapponica]
MEAEETNRLPPDVLWNDATIHARMKIGRDAAEDGKNEHRERWHRAAFLASRLQDGDAVVSGTSTQDEDATRKHLETQHWLELVDGKHRYGSNRLNYLVQIDNEGKLRWARNGDLVDTTPGHWKDAGGGRGIVPADDPDDPEPPPLPRRDSFSDQEADFDARLSAKEEDAALHNAGFDHTQNSIKRAFKNHFTAHGVLERILRRTLRLNIFIGIKGQLDPHTLTLVRPLQLFRRFLTALEERGVDIHKVEISKAETALWG